MAVSYMDFLPDQLTSGSLMTYGTFERFDILVQKANLWLNENPGFTVLTCESAEGKVNTTRAGTTITNNYPTYFESGKHATFYIRFLRLWIKPRGPSDKPGPTQIGYMNVVPACLDPGGMMRSPTFQGFGETVVAINTMFQSQPLPGSIITVETQDFKFEAYNSSIDPDCSFWRESGKFSEYFLNLVRIFYEIGPPSHEQIGTIDFVPQRLAAGGHFSVGDFEIFDSLTRKASAWMQQNAALNVVNVQSIDYKLDQTYGGAEINTQRTLFRESGKFSTYYVKILRVYYTTGGPKPARPINLTYKTFIPCQLTSGNWMSLGQYEFLSTTMERAQAWLNATGVKPVAAETVPVKLFMGHQKSGQTHNGFLNSERTFTYNSGRFAEAYLFVLRIYFNGNYQEPAPEQLPPLPMIQQSPPAATLCNIL